MIKYYRAADVKAISRLESRLCPGISGAYPAGGGGNDKEMEDKGQRTDGPVDAL